VVPRAHYTDARPATHPSAIPDPGPHASADGAQNRGAPSVQHQQGGGWLREALGCFTFTTLFHVRLHLGAHPAATSCHRLLRSPWASPSPSSALLCPRNCAGRATAPPTARPTTHGPYTLLPTLAVRPGLFDRILPAPPRARNNNNHVAETCPR
jgi:hypothetical protein